MLLGSYFILNHALETESITIQPYALQSTNRRDHEDHLEVVRIPDVESTEAAKSGGNFSMCAGDFAEVYATQIGAWDAVLTCFFMDTAQNIIRYIHTIATVIPTGGVWINFGPLLYHFADSVIEPSIELSYEEIKSIASKYFEFKEEKWQDAFYTSCPKSMMQTLYHCVFFVAIRNDKKSPQSIYDECKVTNRTAKDLPLGPEYDGM
ncbi:putative N2227-like domain protein [Gregarina niphandrodes]|uniref:carnosine N-methyltransferase n=1 Tax=Gregarina niphandrodes TaxID=110365 RepID=A0A023B2K0_GRENI|nr:putative N2227-like domain protein [Gregarina niphandrodes]EZG53814.1 putative N2227-like domain protein [Gregarina niphandrodes]|eukprot:XP_011131857.1 putative N2227-like domain protein [Gregarina niphandrodes]